MLKDKVVVVTGGFGILGRAVAEEAARRGAKVAVLDFAPASPDALKADLVVGGVDLSDGPSAEKAMAQVAAKLGGIDALANVAGGFSWQTLADGDPATWDRLHAMNVKTTLHASRAALPYLTKSGGRIVNVGANGAVKAAAGMGAYAASKAGVHRLTESLAEEMKGQVAVNAVLPSIIDTPTNRADMPDADFGAWVTPLDLARVILSWRQTRRGP
jgi:NAD(P)-dependent dehydrogenase (short-subunit alcohol dehydrogenase family)